MSPASALLLCCRSVGWPAFQPNRPSIGPSRSSLQTRFWPSRDAVAVEIVGVGVRQDLLLGDRLEQAEADHRLGDPRREHHIRVHRAVARSATR